MFSNNFYAVPSVENISRVNMSYYNAIDNYAHEGKNVFATMGSDKIRRRPSQFDRALHRTYSQPPQFFRNPLADRLFNRFYWIIRAVQYRIFYKNEEMDIDDGSDRWEVGVQPPPLKQLASRTHFSPRWIKYMYAKFKNECPTGRMREAEFRKLLASIIAAEKATDQYISRLFLAFSGDDRQSITFENLVECLAHLNPQTAEANARWTMRIITGGNEESFGFPAFLAFTESVFALNEGKTTDSEMNLESVQQRAATVFSELDSDHDGLVTSDDMIRFFKTCHQENLVFGDTSSEKSIPNL